MSHQWENLVSQPWEENNIPTMTKNGVPSLGQDVLMGTIYCPNDIAQHWDIKKKVNCPNENKSIVPKKRCYLGHLIYIHISIY